MPNHLKPREEQLKCFEHLKEANIIVNMPTGLGKTLVAVLALEHYLPQGKSIFIVPTAPLVLQQAEYVRRECCYEKLDVLELQAGKMQLDSMRAALVTCNVLVGTSEMMLQAFQNKLVNLADVSLVIFDECHNATGGSPMASFMRDVVHRAEERKPRILGLTASFINGSLASMTEGRQKLEALLSAKIFCPSANPRGVEWYKVEYPRAAVAPDLKAKDFVESLVETMLRAPQKQGLPVENRKELVRQSLHVLQELGMRSLVHHLKMGLLPDLIEKLFDVLKNSPSREAHLKAAKISSEVAVQEAHVEAEAQRFGIDYCNISSKAMELLNLLRKLQGMRILVFCEQIVLVSPLVALMAKETQQGAMAITGTSSMSDSQRKEALEAFRTGDCLILVCTAAVEEGIDVAECQVVIRFSKVATTKAHIQGAGRARKMGARVYYFENDPQLEEEKADRMRVCAQKEHLSLTAEELEDRQGHKDIEGVHPYWNSAGCEISVFNCIRLVMEYCSTAMKQTFDPEEKMMIYEDEVISKVPPVTRKKLVDVIYPSPTGFRSMKLKEVNSIWKDYGLEDVADAERIKKWKPKDRERRRFFYCIAVQLSKDGYINDEHKASDEAKLDVPHKCDAWERPNGIKIQSRVAVQKPAPPDQTPGPIRVGVAAGTPIDNKSTLNMRLNCPLDYRTENSPEGFICTVTLPDGHSFKGKPARSKKDAEQSAAGKALEGAPEGVPTQAQVAVAVNYKGLLNEKYPGEVFYNTVQESSGFVATVRTPHGSFRGAACVSKKNAEKAAAKEALEVSKGTTSPTGSVLENMD